MRLLVTGGGGFLGRAICEQLVARGDEVTSFSRGEHSELRELGVRHERGDVADLPDVSRAMAGCDAVVHVAALAGIWGPAERYERANVLGTENVIAACREHGIGRLVFTSSPSVVFDGTDQEGVDETAPYPERYLAHYPRTKALAERRVLAANDTSLATVALRPHLVWGPGDNHLLPRLVERARAGQLRHVGGGRKLVDSTHVDDAARAHLLALDRLAPNGACAGRTYFISQGEPRPLEELVNGLLGAAGEPRVTRRVPFAVALAAGAVLEAVHATLRLDGEPRMTRFLARQLGTAHWYDITAARRDLGYEPQLSIDDGLERLAQAFRSS